jgi:hypothetical protein
MIYQKNPQKNIKNKKMLKFQPHKDYDLSKKSPKKLKK